MVAKDNGICQDDTFLMCGSQDRPSMDGPAIFFAPIKPQGDEK